MNIVRFHDRVMNTIEQGQFAGGAARRLMRWQLEKRGELVGRDSREILPAIVILAGYSFNGSAVLLKGRVEITFICTIGHCAIRQCPRLNFARHPSVTIEHGE
jgi:hypothetical protein